MTLLDITSNNIIDWSQVITPLAVAVVTFYVVPLLIHVRTYIIKKIGITNYSKAIETAKGIFIALEQQYGSGQGDLKQKIMTQKLHKAYPSLSENDLLAINKTVWSTMKIATDTLFNDTDNASTETETDKTTKLSESKSDVNTNSDVNTESNVPSEKKSSTPTTTKVDEKTVTVRNTKVDDQTGKLITDPNPTLDMIGQDGEPALNDKPAVVTTI